MGAPEKSGLLVTDIDGIGPGKADINITEMAIANGGLYNSARIPSRTITLSLAYIWFPTIEDSRRLSYRMFPLGKMVKLVFETDSRTCEISGYIESNDPKIFSNQEGTTVSIRCPDPYFYSVDENLTVYTGESENFEFEFSNESLSENLIEVGNVTINSALSIFYPGDIDVGMYMEILAVGPVVNLVIYNSENNEAMRINSAKLTSLTGYGIIAGDYITINTVKGQKSIWLRRDGVDINILNALEKTSAWLQLTKGDNVVSYWAEQGSSNINFKVSNRVIYEGV